MAKLKVNDWVMYEGKKRQIAIVNGDGTVRLKSDDPTEKYYDKGTIGCFHKNWLSPVIENKTAVEWLVEQIFFSDQREKFEKYIEQAKEMERQQIEDTFRSRCINFVCSETKNNCSCGIDYYNKTFKSE
jgi:hypothetical protein